MFKLGTYNVMNPRQVREQTDFSLFNTCPAAIIVFFAFAGWTGHDDLAICKRLNMLRRMGCVHI